MLGSERCRSLSNFDCCNAYTDIFAIKVLSDEFQSQLLNRTTMTCSFFFFPTKQVRYLLGFVRLSILLIMFSHYWPDQLSSLFSENIFTGEDIRQQLPKETSVFEGLTTSWRSVSSEMYRELNAVRVCHQSGLFATLNTMLTALEDIQKALAVFLESKRHVFPRFYFISNDDLLEILGNDSHPIQLFSRKYALLLLCNQKVVEHPSC